LGGVFTATEAAVVAVLYVLASTMASRRLGVRKMFALAEDNADLIEGRGATVKFLPPFSHEFNPVEAMWAVVKKHIRAIAPRTPATLRQVARAARHAVNRYHCQFLAKAGHVRSRV
jgi:transposase